LVGEITLQVAEYCDLEAEDLGATRKTYPIYYKDKKAGDLVLDIRYQLPEPKPENPLEDGDEDKWPSSSTTHTQNSSSKAIL
jgi:hypothetical protein